MRNKVKIQLAKEFRKNPTKSEMIMWSTLRNRQFLRLKFRRQHLVDGYLLDFYCHELGLAVEIDGLVHLNREQSKYDKEKQKIIEERKIAFYRCKSIDVELRIDDVLKKLEFL